MGRDETIAGRVARYNRGTRDDAPLARVWSAGDPTPCAHLALPGTSTRVGALAHSIAAKLLRDSVAPSISIRGALAWPEVVRDRLVVVVRLRCHLDDRDAAIAALADAIGVCGHAAGLKHRIEIRP